MGICISRLTVLVPFTVIVETRTAHTTHKLVPITSKKSSWSATFPATQMASDRLKDNGLNNYVNGLNRYLKNLQDPERIFITASLSCLNCEAKITFRHRQIIVNIDISFNTHLYPILASFSPSVASTIQKAAETVEVITV